MSSTENVAFVEVAANSFSTREPNDGTVLTVKSAALEKMTESLSLGEPGGFIRNFVDMGPQMADLLKRVIEKAVNADYAGEILKAFEDDKPVKVQDVPDSPSRPPQPLVEPLTNREIEILELLARRLQNKEIADKLFISPETVKSHLTNIYQKLNVRNRRHAVEKAKNLGIL